jgi:hypothetical protein
MGVMWTGLVWLKIGTKWRALVNAVMNLRFVTVIPKYCNCATVSMDLFCVL